MRLFGLLAPQRAAGGPKSEALIPEQVIAHFDGGATASGVRVGLDSAMRCAAVYSCVRVVSEDVAKLPLILYRRTKDGGKVRAVEHPLYGLFHRRPNKWQTPSTFWRFAQSGQELRGNAYGYISRYKGQPREILPIHPDRVTVVQGGDWGVSFKVRGDPKTYREGELLHIPGGLSLDGVVGLNPIAYHRETIGAQIAATDFGSRVFSNAAAPGVVLTHPNNLSSDAQKRLKAQIDETRSSGAHGTVLLEEGMTVARLGMTSKDAQYIEERKFGRSEIAGLYRVPPHKIADLEHATFSNIEHQSIDYLTDSLLPRLVANEQALNTTLLTAAEQDEFFFEFLIDGLLRGDSKSRFDAYGIAVEKGWMSRNEVRIRENMNPQPGLDEYLRPLNMDTATDTRE